MRVVLKPGLDHTSISITVRGARGGRCTLRPQPGVVYDLNIAGIEHLFARAPEAPAAPQPPVVAPVAPTMPPVVEAAKPVVPAVDLPAPGAADEPAVEPTASPAPITEALEAQGAVDAEPDAAQPILPRQPRNRRG